MEQKFFISCFLVKDDNILMLKKEKGRHIGSWVFPGGEIKPDETALDTVKREIERDTGLTLQNVNLRGITHFMMRTEQNEILAKTILYVFYSDDFTGELTASKKGKLEWIPMDKIWDRQTGRNDKYFVPRMLENNSVTFAKFYHDTHKSLINYSVD